MRRTAAVAALACLLSACGGEDEQATTAAAPATTTAPASAPTATTPAAKPAATTGAVTIKDFEYEPAALEVDAGTEVTWTNQDAANHTVTFAKEGVEGLDNLRAGKRGTVRLTGPGTYTYICAFHPNMKGKVTVR